MERKENGGGLLTAVKQGMFIENMSNVQLDQMEKKKFLQTTLNHWQTDQGSGAGSVSNGDRCSHGDKWTVEGQARSTASEKWCSGGGRLFGKARM